MTESLTVSKKSEVNHDEGPATLAKIEKVTFRNRIERTPCMRDSLLNGIVSGFLVGGVMGLRKSNVMVGCNYAVGCFVCASIVSWETCNYLASRKKVKQHQVAEELKSKYEMILQEKQAEKQNSNAPPHE
eukprot:Sdes_comp19474_c0_seq1m10924